MSVFTMSLKDALEQSGGRYFDMNGRSVVHEPQLIGLGHYPLFDAEYRETLNGLIFDRYMNREIGYETVSMFKLAMRRRMNEMMPQFNLYYESARQNFDPLKTMDIRTVANGETVSESTSDATNETVSESENGTRAINSDFPQTMLAGNSDYATSGADTTAFSEGEGRGTEHGESKNTGKTVSDSSVSGYNGSPAALIREYRDSILNVDVLVLESLNDLFMGVWDVPEQYTNKGQIAWR